LGYLSRWRCNVTGNTFTGQKVASVFAWGKYKDQQGYGNIDWNAIYANNTFDKKVIVKKADNTVEYYDDSYTDGNGTHYFYYVRGIYSEIQIILLIGLLEM